MACSYSCVPVLPEHWRFALKQKSYNIVVCVLLAVLGVYYLATALTAPATALSLIGTYYFPAIMGVLLLVLCALQIIQEIAKKREAETVSLPNLLQIVLMVCATALLLLVWQFLGCFYVWGFLYLLFLLFLFRNKNRFSKRNSIQNVAFALVFDVITYGIFSVLLRISI